MNAEGFAYFAWQVYAHEGWDWDKNAHGWGQCGLCESDWLALNPDRLPDDPAGDDDETAPPPHLDERVSVEEDEDEDE